MRVLVATDAWEPQINGVVRTLQQVRALAVPLGMETRFVTPDEFPTLPMPGYPEIRLALARASALAERIAAFRPDVVHVATEGPIGFAARRASLQSNTPLTTSYHTRFPEYLRARAPVPVALSYAMLRRFHGAADAVLVSTASLEADLRARGFRNLMPWSRGVDLRLYRPRIASTVDWPRPIFLNVGRVAVEKNLEAFLALDLPGTKVVIGDGPQRAALESRYPGVVFLGARTGQELADLYAQADVFVFPSVTDTFGVVILEALASGLPVAAYPVMGPKDILAGTGAGVLSEDLRAAALECLTIPREACLDLAARYSWEASIQQFRDTLAHAAETHAARQAEAA
ncbi:glycosyltransferase family 4 protein [Rhabdaerophilum calidifontis]|uniref:glycosyltransferase family 4 protein n=1 Tax=Rhabdaerophilum calidifontis TaxID=2604328 RepID=UPI00123B78AB|nr:glycosyltransferase family 1 protein [Rhabdaerophilum calidifontis]